MDEYVNQLLEDIALILGNKLNEKKEQPKKSKKALLEEHFKEVDLYISGDAERPLGYFCGMEKEQFPPEERLTKTQKESLSVALIKMMNAFNIEPDFPKNFPMEKAYPFLIQSLNDPITIMSSGTMHIEYCDYDTENCPFGTEFCHCKDIISDYES